MPTPSFPMGEHERRKGKWTLKLLAAHYLYDRVTKDPTVPSTAAVCSVGMDKIVSMRALSRMALHWGVISVPTIASAVRGTDWSPEDLHEVTKAFIYDQVCSTSLDEVLVFLKPYFDECFAYSLETSMDKKAIASEVEQQSNWGNIFKDVLKDLRLISYEDQQKDGMSLRMANGDVRLVGEGWIKVSTLMRRVSRKHPSILHAQPIHFMNRVMDYDGMLKLQAVKDDAGLAQERTKRLGQDVDTGDFIFMRATYCHRDDRVASEVLASHVRLGAMEGPPTTCNGSSATVFYEFVESVKRIDPARAKHGMCQMVPFRPFLLFQESRVAAIRRRSATDASFASSNKINLNDSVFVKCLEQKLSELIVVQWPRGHPPPSRPSRDAKVEIVAQQYHVILPHMLKLEEGEEGLTMVPCENSMRCNALIPVSFGVRVPHLFPVLSDVSLSAESKNEVLPISSNIASFPVGEKSLNSDVSDSHVSPLPPPSEVSSPLFPLTPTSPYPKEVQQLQEWMANEEEGADYLLMSVVTTEKRAIARLRVLFTPIVEEYNASSTAPNRVVMYDGSSRADMISRFLKLRHIEEDAMKGSVGSPPPIRFLFYRTASAAVCAQRLASDVLGTTNSPPPKDLCLLLETVLHPTRFELLEFLGDAVIDYITAFRLWDSVDSTSLGRAAVVGQEVSRETNNLTLSNKLPSVYRHYVEWVLGRSTSKHFADTCESIVGAFYYYGCFACGEKEDDRGRALPPSNIREGIKMAKLFVDYLATTCK